jgi:hypothetical protein
MGTNMVKEHLLYLMEVSMKENGKMGKRLVKEHLLYMMGESMWGNTRMGKSGTEHFMTKTET